MSKQFHLLKVATVRYDTEEAVQIGFKIPLHLKEKFVFDPGQYLTIKATVNDEILRRAYSISSPIQEEVISVVVKRLTGGKVSNFLNDQIKVGDQFEVMPPGGHFKLSVDKKHQNNYFFFGAGSGITPLMSMIHSILEKEPLSKCYLLYGNRNETSTIFNNKLKRLSLVYQNRLVVEHILSRPLKEKPKGILGNFFPAVAKWKGQVGRINSQMIGSFLKQHAEDKTIQGYYICGPGPMIETTVNALKTLDIDQSIIHREYFSAPDVDPIKESKAIKVEKAFPSKVTVNLNGHTHEITIKDDTNIVQALINQNIEPPYSCLSGTCSTCMAKITKGAVDMDVSIGLEDDERAKGYILTCQSHPTTEEVELTFDIED